MVMWRAMKRHTIAEVAERLSVPSETARGLVMLLVEKKIIEPVGVKPITRGRSANVYEFPDGYEQHVAQVLLEAQLTR